MGEKRGQAILSTLIYPAVELGLIVLIIYLTYTTVDRAVNDQTYVKRFVARDVALTVEALHASEGDFEFFYSIRTPKMIDLNVYLEQSKVSVSNYIEQPKENKGDISFLFATDSSIKVNPSSSINSSQTCRYDVKANNYARQLTISKKDTDLKLTDADPRDRELIASDVT